MVRNLFEEVDVEDIGEDFSVDTKKLTVLEQQEKPCRMCGTKGLLRDKEGNVTRCPKCSGEGRHRGRH